MEKGGGGGGGGGGLQPLVAPPPPPPPGSAPDLSLDDIVNVYGGVMSQQWQLAKTGAFIEISQDCAQVRHTTYNYFPVHANICSPITVYLNSFITHIALHHTLLPNYIQNCGSFRIVSVVFMLRVLCTTLLRSNQS